MAYVGKADQETAKAQHTTQRMRLKHFISTDLADGVKEMNVEGSLVEEDSYGGQLREGKGRVSFGTNMTMDDESSETGSVHKSPSQFETAIERFHARKFGGNPKQSLEKKSALRVKGTGSTKKQKTPIKEKAKAAMVSLAADEKESQRTQEMTLVQGKMEEDLTQEVVFPILDQKNLMGTPAEARQEQ
jgi:hypothetical protein